MICVFIICVVLHFSGFRTKSRAPDGNIRYLPVSTYTHTYMRLRKSSEKRFSEKHKDCRNEWKCVHNGRLIFRLQVVFSTIFSLYISSGHWVMSIFWPPSSVQCALVTEIAFEKCLINMCTTQTHRHVYSLGTQWAHAYDNFFLCLCVPGRVYLRG